jgi:hypothetical protein
MTTRFVEGVCGVLATLWGLLVEGYLLFGPSYSFVGGTNQGSETTGHTGLVGTGIAPATVVSLSLLALILLGIGGAALLDSRSPATPRFRIILVMATVFLLLYTCAAIASIGFLLLPSGILALIAVVLSGIVARHPMGQQPSRS